MPEPTLAYHESNWGDTAASETSASITWADGDTVVVLGITEDNSVTMGTPTVTGLTFTALAGSPTNGASSCKAYGWKATAVGSGSGAVTSALTGGDNAGISVWVCSASAGVGNLSIASGLGATTTQSLIRAGVDSAVIQAWGDWSAINDVAVTLTPTTPVVGTQREATFISGAATFFVADWGDQDAAGTTSYGFTDHAGGAAMSAITVEILGLPDRVAYSYASFPKPKLRG